MWNWNVSFFLFRIDCLSEQHAVEPLNLFLVSIQYNSSQSGNLKKNCPWISEWWLQSHWIYIFISAWSTLSSANAYLNWFQCRGCLFVRYQQFSAQRFSICLHLREIRFHKCRTQYTWIFLSSNITLKWQIKGARESEKRRHPKIFFKRFCHSIFGMERQQKKWSLKRCYKYVRWKQKVKVAKIKAKP